MNSTTVTPVVTPNKKGNMHTDLADEKSNSTTVDDANTIDNLTVQSDVVLNTESPNIKRAMNENIHCLGIRSLRKNQKVVKTDITHLLLERLNKGHVRDKLLLKIQYKCDVKLVKENLKVGSIIVSDTNGTTANVIIFGDNMISTHFYTIDEDDIIEIENFECRISDNRYSLCESKFDIILNLSTKITKLEEVDKCYVFPYKYSPMTIANIKASVKNNDIKVVDCIGLINSGILVETGATFKRGKVEIIDMTGSIFLWAWGDKMIDLLYATSSVEVKVFAFIRLQVKTYDNTAYLHLNDGGDILEHIDHPKFETFKTWATLEKKETEKVSNTD
jgi:hypothetical protein